MMAGTCFKKNKGSVSAANKLKSIIYGFTHFGKVGEEQRPTQLRHFSLNTLTIRWATTN